ncbi:YheC/YheD family protein [Cohnella kolymensis]|nr:YheC/YheD family protein [Cohnella kolymensis]
MKDPIMKHYVPDTDWFEYSSLHKMLKTYSCVYIKPDSGNKGTGIIRVKKLNSKECEISYKKTTSRSSPDKLYSRIKKILKPEKKYIIQQGVDLATYQNRPFDVRVVLQKPLGKWRATLMSAKLAPHKSSVVTNVAKGAEDRNLYKLLKGTDQSLNSFAVLRDLMDASHQIAQILSSHFPLNILGLDMGIDKKGKVWFIEANTKPECSGMKRYDGKLYRRYLHAKKIIKKE